MFSMTRTVFRVGVISVLGAGGLALLVGHQPVMALFSQAKGSVTSQIDQLVTDPVALRIQLRDLESQYPKRIAQVRSDLGELRTQLAQLQREGNVTQRVIDLAASDLGTLQQLVSQAEDARATIIPASFSDEAPAPRRIEIVFEDQRLSVEQAYARTAEVNNTRTAYTQRLGDIQRDLGYLTNQESRLAGLLTKLENERSQFQVQLWQLDRQVDSIARNDRMIEVLQRRQEAIDEQSRYKAASLDHLQSKIADIRGKQEAELAGLAGAEQRTNYESRAKLDLDAKAAHAALKEAATRKPDAKSTKSEVIEIRPLAPLPAGRVQEPKASASVNAAAGIN